MTRAAHAGSDMADCVFRDARTEDAEGMAAVYAPYVESTSVSFELTAPSAAEMATRIAEKRDSGFPWLALEVGGRLAGYAYYGSWRARDAYRNTVESAIYLDGEFQGRGLATRLYAALIARARDEGRRAMIGVIALPNDASEALHRRLGFERAGLFREVGYKAGRWLDVAFWELLL